MDRRWQTWRNSPFVQKQYQNAYDFYTRAFRVPEDSPFAISENATIRSAYAISVLLFLPNNSAITQDEAMALLEQACSRNHRAMSQVQFELGNMYHWKCNNLKKHVQHIEIANALQVDKPQVLAALGYTWFHLEI